MRGGGAQMICCYEKISVDPLADPVFGQVGGYIIVL